MQLITNYSQNHSNSKPLPPLLFSAHASTRVQSGKGKPGKTGKNDIFGKKSGKTAGKVPLQSQKSEKNNINFMRSGKKIFK